jgi:cytochrome c-type biogenesis protein CcmH/NrfG
MELTKRDYFAGQALNALLRRDHSSVGTGSLYERIAVEAYHYADAMMRHTRTLHDPVEIDPEDLSRRQGNSPEEIHLVPNA